MDRQEVLDVAREAQGKLFEAIESLEWVINQLPVDGGYWDAYLLAKLKIAASGESGYVTRDPNVTKLIEAIEELEEA